LRIESGEAVGMAASTGWTFGGGFATVRLRVTGWARTRWDRALVFALAVTACSYGLFDVWLKARLSKGVFGF
jgi:hypothetical protein